MLLQQHNIAFRREIDISPLFRLTDIIIITGPVIPDGFTVRLVVLTVPCCQNVIWTYSAS